MRTSCPTRLICLNLIILTVLDGEYKLLALRVINSSNGHLQLSDVLNSVTSE
jgi:hypothetical protein